MMSTGFGATIGSLVSGWMIDRYYTFATETVINGMTYAAGSRDWQGIWFAFSMYALCVLIAFSLLFKHQHQKTQ
jgi:MFS family permease